jgi:diguanylate cyclase (GGDEF)-like protein/PAS domain S-box-containing protein
MAGAPLLDDQGRVVGVLNLVTDISDRRRAEDALRANEAELRAIFGSMNDAVFVLNREGRYLKVARTSSEMVFGSSQVLVGKLMHEVLPTARADEFVRCIQCALDSGERQTIEYSLPTTGEEHWFEARISPMGKDRVVWVSTDITQRRQSENLIEATERKYRNIFENAIEGISQSTPDGVYVTANPMLAQIFGYSSPEELMSSITNIGNQLYVEPGRREKFIELMNTQGFVARFESRIRRRDGSIIWISENARALYNDNGALIGYEGTTVDITDIKEAEAALRISENRLRAIVEHSSNLFYSHTANHVLTYVSPQVRHFFDCDAEEALVRWTEFTTDNPINEEGFRIAQRAIDTGERQPPYRLELKTRKGRILCVEANEAPVVRDGRTVAIVGALVDITKRTEAEQRLEHQAFHDSLTGLPNRALFMDRLQHALARAQRHHEQSAILFLDLDRFKVINDSLGHEVGDHLLQTVALRLQECLRPDDTAARLGGDEFVILLEDIRDVGDAIQVADRIAQQLQTPFTLDGHEVIVTTSIGIKMTQASMQEAESSTGSDEKPIIRARTKQPRKARKASPTGDFLPTHSCATPMSRCIAPKAKVALSMKCSIRR